MGKYVNSHLVKGERIVHTTNLLSMLYLTMRAIFALWIAPLIQQTKSEFTITSIRIIIKIGLIACKNLGMNLNKIGTANVYRSIPRQILRFGKITVSGTGDTREVFNNLDEICSRGGCLHW